MASSQAAEQPPWHEAFPSPVITAPTVSRAEVIEWIRERRAQGADAKVDYVLVDLRRADHEGGTIATSINLPAQSLYPSLPVLYQIFKQAGIKKVVFYCGSSRGRGTRAGGWFADFVEAQNDGSGIQSLVLEGGIKGWVGAGEGYVSQVEGYDEAVWKKFTS